MFKKRPYLVVPKLIEQPTWGGTYIVTSKHWDGKPEVKGKKFGQSYELFGKSKFRLDLNNSADAEHLPEVGNPDNDETDELKLKEGEQYVGLEAITAEHVPILIKLTQALGNSFQIHVKPGTVDDRWKPKPETWYYFEDGMATCGLAPQVDVAAYKKCCEEISSFMKDLSRQVMGRQLPLQEAKTKAKEFIQKQNPWQYVNIVHVKKNDVVDMSAGAIHHSWEEDKEKYPLGNTLYEVQADVMDPVSTLRSFDQGKIKNDGSIRPIEIEDYFKFLDTDPKHNKTDKNITHPTGRELTKTPFYSLDRLTATSQMSDATKNSFAHFYVQEGVLKVTAADGAVTVTVGHSCFIPKETGEYQIENVGAPCTILKAYL